VVDDIEQLVRRVVENVHGTPNFQLVRKRSRRIRAAKMGTLVVVLAALGAAIPLTHLGDLVGPGRSGQAAGRALPTKATITCNANGTEVAASKVQPQEDGVHFAVSNQTGKVGRFSVAGYGSRRLVEGESEIVFPVPPGTVRVRCGHRLPQNLAAIDVIDVSGVWRSPHLDCAHPSFYAITDQSPETGIGLVGAARERMHGLTDQDQVQTAGYPSAKGTRYARVVQDGKVVASLSFEAALGGLIFKGAGFCPGSGIS
jgi:hypothetical protein